MARDRTETSNNLPKSLSRQFAFMSDETTYGKIARGGFDHRQKSLAESVGERGSGTWHRWNAHPEDFEKKQVCSLIIGLAD